MLVKETHGGHAHAAHTKTIYIFATKIYFIIDALVTYLG